MTIFRSLMCAGALALMMTAPALADEEHGNGGNGNHFGWDKGDKVSHSAPGPEIGVGLPAFLIAGYLWYRRRSKQR